MGIIRELRTLIHKRSWDGNDRSFLKTAQIRWDEMTIYQHLTIFHLSTMFAMFCDTLRQEPLLIVGRSCNKLDRYHLPFAAFLMTIPNHPCCFRVTPLVPLPGFDHQPTRSGWGGPRGGFAPHLLAAHLLRQAGGEGGGLVDGSNHITVLVGLKRLDGALQVFTFRSHKGCVIVSLRPPRPFRGQERSAASDEATLPGNCPSVDPGILQWSRAALQKIGEPGACDVGGLSSGSASKDVYNKKISGTGMMLWW